MLIDDKKRLKGLPVSVIDMAKSLAIQRDKKGWIFTLDSPSYVPFITYSEDRELRKKFVLLMGKEALKIIAITTQKSFLK